MNEINNNTGNINLFNLNPFQDFSKLTGFTAIGLLVFIYPWMLINPELLGDPILFANVAIYSLIAIIVFVWPLWGVHRIIDQEKQKVLHEIDLRFEALLVEFNKHVDDGDYGASEKLHGTITSLDIQRKRINATPTWPWSSDTARLVPDRGRTTDHADDPAVFYFPSFRQVTRCGAESVFFIHKLNILLRSSSRNTIREKSIN